MQTVLVAGGAGFIGSHLCRDLLSKQFKVVCIDNLITGDKKNIESLLQDSNFLFIEHDVSVGLSTLRSQLPEIDYIFHLASPASPNKNSKKSYMAFPLETLLVNSSGTHNLLQLALEDNASFLYASSSEVYGDPTVSPQDETYFGNVNPIGPRSVYDEGKRFGEAITMAYVRKFNVNARVIRIFNTYGPFMQPDDGRVVSNFVNQALSGNPITIYGDGTQTRSFCYVDDMVQGIQKAMFEEDTSGIVVNLGNPGERTIKEIATLIKEMVQSSSEIVYKELPEDDPKKRKPDIEKAKQVLHWEPTISLEEGLKKTIEHFKNI